MSNIFRITQKLLNEIDRFTINLPYYLNEANYFRWNIYFCTLHYRLQSISDIILELNAQFLPLRAYNMNAYNS